MAYWPLVFRGWNVRVRETSGLALYRYAAVEPEGALLVLPQAVVGDVGVAAQGGALCLGITDLALHGALR